MSESEAPSAPSGALEVPVGLPIMCCAGSFSGQTGLAALSDLSDPEWKRRFDRLEAAQAAFLSLETSFRSADYRWPSDPLHTWSRVWEYPFVEANIEREVRRLKRRARILDFGPGVTFFPFAVANLDADVIGADVDSVCVRDLKAATQVVQLKCGSVQPHLVKRRLPFADGEFDISYSVSVLEHINDPVESLMEIRRVTRRHGLVILTMDLDRRGDSELGLVKYRAFRAAVAAHFSLVYPEATVHPTDVLTTRCSPYAEKALVGTARIIWLLKQHVVKRLLGRRPTFPAPIDLAVLGLVLRKL